MFTRRILLILLSCSALGCPSRDNPFDPILCNPRCPADKVCYSGRCLARAGDGALGDGALGDARAADFVAEVGQDTGGATPPPIVFSTRPATEISLDAEGQQDLDIAPLTIESNGGDYFVMLNIPETWVTVPGYGGGGTFFIVLDGGTILASGHYNGGSSTQRVPVTIVGVTGLAAGTHTITARWKRDVSGSLHLGAQHQAWLVAVRADGGVKFATGPQSEIAAKSSWSTIDCTRLTVDSSGGDYLIVLNVPMTWITATGALAEFAIIVDDTKGIAGGNYTTAFAGQRVPIAVIGAANLPPGSHTIHAIWKGANARITNNHQTWMVALGAPGGIVQGARPPAVATATTNDWVDVGIAPLSLASTGGDHLLILNAADTWTTPVAGAWAAFQILVDEAALASGTYSTGLAEQRVPLTVVGVTRLTAGSHSVVARWQVPGNGQAANQGVNFPTRLIAFTP